MNITLIAGSGKIHTPEFNFILRIESTDVITPGLATLRQD